MNQPDSKCGALYRAASMKDDSSQGEIACDSSLIRDLSGDLKLSGTFAWSHVAPVNWPGTVSI